ncbi:MAG: undecaprenyl-diphosphate phosphatase [Bacilli bacterium]|nr:undecaprenyl-diphosphate phosphatase [Bacilli bacterium]MDD4053242.1 undecaprenyl-diphosphate phosphatase [Bacilli bacterium]MDD4411234.1 undecaprenyl-diphosphate phosphatase [Bacilli bacterium]
MEIFEIIKAFILGVVQGITEWLPISSTGHLIIIEDIFKFNLSDSFVNTFFVLIQLGSIIAVVVLFFKKLNPFKREEKERNDTINLWLKIAVATIPAGIAGFLFEEQIDTLLYNSVTVAIMLIFYGVIFILLESKNKKPLTTELPQISFKLALGIGLFQMLALVPGTSRSGATIIGAVFLGTSRYIASEFSFFLAIPTMLGASFYKLMKSGFVFSSLEIMVLVVGSITAFVVSLWAIKFLLDYIKNHDFKVFGYYRIILGLLVLFFYFFI